MKNYNSGNETPTIKFGVSKFAVLHRGKLKTQSRALPHQLRENVISYTLGSTMYKCYRDVNENDVKLKFSSKKKVRRI